MNREHYNRRLLFIAHYKPYVYLKQIKTPIDVGYIKRYIIFVVNYNAFL